ncbi:MAG TPA: glycosyltransferase family 4 protein, partial [Chloroflexota bacterium]|nr:glycosyltransferase family 4 protein [Chloroflexota bacterium]
MDEGLKKFVYSVMGPLRETVNLVVVSTEGTGPVGSGVDMVCANRFMLEPKLRQVFREFRPDGVIYVPRAAATRNAFVRARVLRGYWPRARQMMISLQPRSYGSLSRAIIRWMHPDVFAAQGHAVRDGVASLGVNAIAIPSGVDIDSFAPVAPDEGIRLRRKYGIEASAPVVLHIGHLKRERNVLLLTRIREELGCSAVMVASTSTVAEPDVAETLRAAGVLTLDSYIENVAELYQLADCYLFPVRTSGGAIEMPLSVLEAMASGTPVVSSPFGSLPDWLPAGPGLAYARDDDGLVHEVQAVLSGDRGPNPNAIRDRMQAFSWPSIAERICEGLGLTATSSALD